MMPQAETDARRVGAKSRGRQPQRAATGDPPLAKRTRVLIVSPTLSGGGAERFTSTLLHGGFIPAAFNVYWMAVFGPALEQRLGSCRILGLIVLLGYVSMLPQFIVSNYSQPLDEQIPVVGLSGVIYGLFGMLLVGRRWYAEFEAVCDFSTRQILIGWFVICIFLTHFKLLPVANVAHCGGLLFGILSQLFSLALAFFHPFRLQFFHKGFYCFCHITLRENHSPIGW